MNSRRWLAGVIIAVTVRVAPPLVAAEPPAAYAAVEALFARHCLDCHATQEPEGGLVLETFASLAKGGESGPVIVPGKSGDSLLIKSVEVGLDRDGRKKIMPPGKREKLTPGEIAVLRSWIDAGAVAPKETARKTVRDLVVSRIPPTVTPPRAIRAAAYSASLKLVALARHAEVELISPESREVVRTLGGLRGAVTALAFSKDGKTLAVAAGEPAMFGEATIWNAADGTRLRTIEGHTDSLYAIALSPDGTTLATGSYDQKIKLWNLLSGELRHTLSAHNAAIYSLAFRPDGRILASASGDRTVKLWQADTGKRVETFSQPLKEVHAVAWSPDGKRLAAAGVDNRIRVWEITEAATETSNPLLVARFAHEGALLNLAWSSDGKTLVSTAEDQTVKLWDATQITERIALKNQPDLAPALAFLADARSLLVGRLDGSWDIYDTEKGTRLAPPPPGLSGIEPRGLGPGRPVWMTLRGTNLAGITNLEPSHPGLRVAQLAVTNGVATAMVEAGPEVPRGAHDLRAQGPGGDSGRVKIFVDDVPQRVEAGATGPLQMPFAVWGALQAPAESDEFQIEAKAGQTIVFELATRTIGSKLQNGTIALLDKDGRTLASDGGFDGGDRFVAAAIARDGLHTVRVTDSMRTGSRDHAYRLTVGILPVVTGVFPLSVPSRAETAVQLLGHNLPTNAVVRLVSKGPGELDVPVDPSRFRTVRAFKVLVADGAHPVEVEHNDQPSEASPVVVPSSVNGRIRHAGDVDLFSFEARRGQRLILETDAARRGSAVDTQIEVLDRGGRLVPRLVLQAVRNTAINFRGVDSNGTGLRLDNYEEMELDEYLYLNGDVMRLFRMPQGPDSDMLMYTSAGKRRAYFDTTAVSHALDEQGFIVEPRAIGTPLVANGLPVFAIHFRNDDDGERRLGTDSRVHFDPPADGVYLARISDTRERGGETHGYRLVIREAQPDFNVTLAGVNPKVPPGSGQSFTVTAERIDGFEGEIHVTINGLPDGFSVSSPLVIEAGHSEAKGTIFASMHAAKPDATNAATSKVTASATLAGKTVVKPVNPLGTIQLGSAPKVYVALEPDSGTATNHLDPKTPSAGPVELTIRPGETIPAWLKIHRNGHKELVTFFAENLPHGVIVADIGLNGVLIPKEESQRRIFFNAAKWVTEQDRLFYMIEQQAGRQTSRPVLLKVRPAGR